MASDILDVLNISDETRVEGQELKKRKHQLAQAESEERRKKRNAMNRELYNLIGPNVPPVALHKESGVKFKEKRDKNGETKWVWKQFKNGSRSEDQDLELYHWVKERVDKSDEQVDDTYRFEKYNTHLDIPDFTEELYESKLKDLDEDWSYNETRYLFDLAKQFDLRWAVIADEYDYEPSEEEKKLRLQHLKEKEEAEAKEAKEVEDEDGKENEAEKADEDDQEDQEDQEADEDETDEDKLARTIEELKERLYNVSAVILDDAPVATKDTTLIKNLKAYSRTKELERKQYLTHLLERSPTEIAEEESLVIEARKLELAAKKMLTERAQLLQLLDSPQATASAQRYMSSAGLTQLYNNLINADKSKKRKPEAPVAPQLGPNALPHTQVLQDRQNRASKPHAGTPAEENAIQELLNAHLTPEQMEVYGINVHAEKLQPGVIIRTQKLPTFRPAVQTKVNEILNELALAPRPTIPTAKVCERYDSLLHEAAQLVDIKKQKDKLEAEIALIKQQKGID